MNSESIKAYCQEQGIPFQQNDRGVRVLDGSQLPDVMRGVLDASGFIAVEPLAPDSIGADVVTEDVVIPKAKRGKK